MVSIASPLTSLDQYSALQDVTQECVLSNRVPGCRKTAGWTVNDKSGVDPDAMPASNRVKPEGDSRNEEPCFHGACRARGCAGGNGRPAFSDPSTGTESGYRSLAGREVGERSRRSQLAAGGVCRAGAPSH